MERRGRTTDAQFAVLVDYMERHGDLNRPQPGPQGRLTADQMWLELSTHLNSIDGGVTKTPDKWKKVWTDWKSKTKTKAILIRNQAKDSSGDTSRKPLSTLEQRVMAIMIEDAGTTEGGNEKLNFQVKTEQQEQVEATVDVSWMLNGNNSSDTSQPQSEHTVSGFQTEPNQTVQIKIERDSSPEAIRNSPTIRLPRQRTTLATDTSNHRRHPLTRPYLRPHTRRKMSLQRASSEFVSIEKRRLELEHERELLRIDVDRQRVDVDRQRLDIHRQRVDVDRQRNDLLHRFINVVEKCSEAYIKQSKPPV